MTARSPGGHEASRATGRPALVVHGGAGGGGQREQRSAGVRAAADAAWGVLTAGGAAVDAVETAVRLLEDDPVFNAGFGSALNRDGEVEVDAVIMDGADLAFGAVACVPRVRHAVTLARHVLTDSPHALLAGPGAEALARQVGLVVPGIDLVTPAALSRWRGPRGGAPAGTTSGAGASDTVGAVAVDGDGHVAAATSTGGLQAKWPGRVGDSPIVGAGAYADDGAGAISATGVGEEIMRVCVAHRAWMALDAGRDAAAAAHEALAALEARTPGKAGLIVVGARGDVGWAFNTAAMPYAWRSGDRSGEGFRHPDR